MNDNFVFLTGFGLIVSATGLTLYRTHQHYPLYSTILLYILLTLTTAFQLLTRTVDPGRLKKQPVIVVQEPGIPRDYPFMEQEVVILNGHRLPLKFCQTCNIYRPPRASHCAECDCCIDRMDHHCPWVANCVGKRNHKFFLAFLWSCALLATQVLVISILELMQRIDEMLYPCIVSIGTVFSLYGMALYHSFLVFTNQTTRQQVIVLMVDQKASQYLRQRTNRELFRVLQ